MDSLLGLVRARRAELQAIAALGRDDQEAQRLEASLIDFVEAAWPSLDAAEYKSCWAIDALCEHLQAVTDGQIRKLLVNFPPRCAKTLVTSVCWPAWTWSRRWRSYRSGPQVRFLCGSYSHTLSLMNSNLTRRLITSPWYAGHWSTRFRLREDQNTKMQFDTDAGGSRLASSVGGSLLGLGGDVLIVDDPHNTESVESEAERENVLTWFKELSTTRLNDPKQAALVVIMQRLHEADVSGHILSSDDDDFVHLMIPMEYEWRRHCVTSLGWHDPRGVSDDGEPLIEMTADGPVPFDPEAEQILEQERNGALMWPERFGPAEVAAMHAGLGPYLASGRLQQSPQPRGGGLFRREWWQLWDAPDGKFPVCDLVVASVDGAFTQKEENDPSAMTVWAVFRHPELQRRRIILIHAWRKFLPMHGNPTPRFDHEMTRPGDTPAVVRAKNARWRHRVGHEWGLVEWVAETCRAWGVHKLLIEGKASGITAAQELQRLYGREPWSVQLINPKSDKVARALAVQPLFANGQIYAPARDWSELVIEEMMMFPRGRYDDLTDTASMALNYLRSVGEALTDVEVKADEIGGVMHKPRLPALYPC
jgi:predicted phage terminase large subunit-like protein